VHPLVANPEAVVVAILAAIVIADQAAVDQAAVNLLVVDLAAVAAVPLEQL
jgi:hypothetical protein